MCQVTDHGVIVRLFQQKDDLDAGFGSRGLSSSFQLQAVVKGDKGD